MEKFKIIILSILTIIILIGCQVSENNNTDTSLNLNKEVSENNNTDTSLNLNIQDFNVKYKDIIINDIIPFEQIRNSLLISSNADHENISIKTSSTGESDNEYTWYVVFYPSKKDKEIIIEYVKNHTLNEEYLVKIKILNKTAKTHRDIKVDDNIDKLISVYGKPIDPIFSNSTEDYYYYSLNNESKDSERDKTIDIILDKITKRIVEISINYNGDRAMEEMDIISFD